MSSSLLRFYYNRKSGPQSRPQVLSEISSKLDRTDAPFALDAPYSTSPFTLDFTVPKTGKEYEDDERTIFYEPQQSAYFPCDSYTGSSLRSLPGRYSRQFSTRVIETEAPDLWKQRMALRFDPSPSTFSWNSTGSPVEEGKSGSEERDTQRVPLNTQRMHDNTHQSSKCPDHFKSALIMCISVNDGRSALKVLENMNTAGAEFDLKLSVSALKLIGEGGDNDCSSQLKKLCLSFMYQRSSSSRSTLLLESLEALYRLGDWTTCVELAQDLQYSTLPTSIHPKVYEKVLRTCSDSAGKNVNNEPSPADAALTMLCAIEKPSSRLVLFVLRALSRDGRPEQALELYRKHGGGYGKALTHALHACALASKQTLGLEQWDDTAVGLLEMTKSKANLNHHNVTLSAISAGGKLTRALAFVDEMNASSSVKPDSYTWSTLLWACSTSQSLPQAREPDGACVALELMDQLKQTQPAKSLTSQVYAAAIRAAVGVAGPSYPKYSAPPELRIDPSTGHASTMGKFVVEHGNQEGLKMWEKAKDSGALGLWKNMVDGGISPPPDATTGLLYHTKTNLGVVEAAHIAKELLGDQSGWRGRSIANDECYYAAMEILVEANCQQEADQLAQLKALKR